MRRAFPRKTEEQKALILFSTKNVTPQCGVDEGAGTRTGDGKAGETFS
jgi:hypothetical protein